MRTLIAALTSLLFLVVSPFALHAQSTSPQHAAARARFQGYDTGRDGDLRDVELMRCDCHAADQNGDGEVTFEEYVQPRGSVIRTYRLVQFAGRALPYPAPDGSGEVLSARLTLYSTGVVVYRLTAREPGGPDTTAVFSGRYEIEGDQLSHRIPPFRAATGRITGTDLRIRMGPDGEWTLWRRVSVSASTGAQRSQITGIAAYESGGPVGLGALTDLAVRVNAGDYGGRSPMASPSSFIAFRQVNGGLAPPWSTRPRPLRVTQIVAELQHSLRNKQLHEDSHLKT